MNEHRIGAFTLIELLVVILIAGIVTSIVLLQLPPAGEQARFERELARLEARLSVMCDEALLTGTVHGIRFRDSGYAFFRLGLEGWQPVAVGPLSETRDWPDGQAPRLTVAGRRLVPAVADAPQVLCSGIEPATPFEARFGSGPNAAELAWPG